MKHLITSSIKHQASSIQHLASSITFFSMFLAVLLLCGTTLAQTNSQYTFRQQSLLDGDSFGPGDPVPVLTMDCLAANGYGQWSMTTMPNGSYGAGWYLLENGLRKPSVMYDGTSAHPECVTPGVVANGAFTMAPHGAPKNATNLLGSVRYVCPISSSGATSFVVQGFDAPSVPLIVPSGFPNATNSRKIVSAAVTNVYPPVSTYVGGMLQPLYNDSDPRDDYDVSCDGTWLYLTWCSAGQIYISVTSMLTGAFPTTGTWPMPLGPGFRPTVACDTRYIDMGSGPQFDVAYISALSGGTIISLTYSGGVLGANSLVNQFWNPTAPGMIPYTNPTHVRALMTEVKGQTSPGHSVYAIVLENTTNLILYKPIQAGPNVATYVDGWLLPYSNPPIPTSYMGIPPSVVNAPIIAFANPYDNQSGAYDQYHCLYQLNVQIGPSAFVNPLLIVQGFNTGAMFPLITADTRLCLNQNIPTGGGAGTLLEDPLSYVGAVNQMGIHVHWRTAENVHFYTRDTSRTFDEPVDENTLVTDICQVTDGTSHGGTVGATIIRNGQMTVWTDPTYGQPSTGSSIDGVGLYQPRTGALRNTQIVGRLEFVGENVQLNVGDGSYIDEEAGRVYNSATLTVVPYFYFDFLGSSYGSTQGVTIMPNSKFQYYGLNQQHSSTPSTYTPFTDGTNSTFGGGVITLQGLLGSGGLVVPAFLEVHGGADFFTGKNGYLVSNYGQVDVLFEPRVYPINSSGAANGSVTGHMTLLGQSTLTNSNVNGNIPGSIYSLPLGIIMTVDAGFNQIDHPSATYQFSATNCSFVNSDPDALSELRFGHANRSTTSFWNSTFNGGTTSSVKIHEIDPDFNCNIMIENLTISNLMDVNPTYFPDANCILIENDENPTSTSYGAITVSDNTFTNIHELVFDGTLEAIYLKGFDGTPSIEDPLGPVTISGNIFTYTNPNWVDDDPPVSAITVENTTANILGNTITDQGYNFGIIVKATLPTGFSIAPDTYSLICSNTIAYPSTVTDFPELICIQSDHLNGYVKLNTLGNALIEYYSQGKDHPHLIYNTLTEGNSAVFGYDAIDISDYAHVDMSGVHGASSGGDDYAANNTITGYPDGGVGMIKLNGSSTQLDLGQQVSWWTNFGGNNFDVTGHFSRVAASSVIDIGNIDRTYWGASTISPPITTSGSCACNWNSADGSEVDASNIKFNEAATALTSPSSVPDGTTCEYGTGYRAQKRKPITPASALDTSTTSCEALISSANAYEDNYLWQLAYDTSKRFIEHCPNAYQSWRAFNYMSGSVQHLWLSDTSLYAQFRQWLESVLYLNTTDPDYFCVCVETIGGTFNYRSDTTEQLGWKATNRGLAVIRWLLQNTGCDTSMLRRYYTGARSSQRASWLNDTTITLDTTLPSMHDLGLDSILALHFSSVAQSPALFGSVLSSLALSENPFTSNTSLRFNLNRMAYVRMEVFDELGRMIIGDGTGKVYDPGSHQLPIDLHGFASGAYYVRVSLADGEVRTLKMVKQE